MKLPTSQYRGVVAQQNGKWGAQIYKNNERVWLGTFYSELEAAKTYDIAACCLHDTNAITNFNPFSKFDKNTEAELKFLKSHSVTEVLSMLRRGTYHEELNRNLKIKQIKHMQSSNTGEVISNTERGTRELLFFKLVSPGDLGPQSRLLIPRQHVQKHFHPFGSGNNADDRGVAISFEDENGKIWRFRYAYWRSSGNHVLNGGWVQFAREKGLRPGDLVQFWHATDEIGTARFFIDCETKRIASVQSQELELPISQPNERIRLFGVDVSVSVHNY